MSYASANGRTPGILNGLGNAPPPDSGAQPSAPPSGSVVNTAPNNQSPQIPSAGAPNVVKSRVLGVVKAVADGHLPGVHIPSDAPKIKSDMTANQIMGMGVGIYKPKSKGIAGVVFNPKSVPQSTLKALDSKGRLAQAFPSITKFLSGRGQSGAGSPGNNARETGANAPAGGMGDLNAGSGAGQTGRNVSNVSDLNLTANSGPTPNPVPVLPRPGMGAAANAQLASKRATAINGQPAWQQTKPQAGSIVSNLWRAPV